MTNFINNYKKTSNSWRFLLNISVATSLALATLAAIAPIPWVSICYNKNYENFFSIPSFKIAKINLTSFSSKILEQVGDKRIKEILINYITNYSWVDKNITASFAVTKADTRDLVDISANNDTETMSRYAISNVDVKYTDFDKEKSETAVKLISKYIIILNGREVYLKFLNDVLKEQEFAQLDATKLLPDISLTLGANQSRLNKVIEIETEKKNSSDPMPSIQFNLTQSALSKETQKIINPFDSEMDLLAFLPAHIQHSGLDIQQAMLNGRLEQLKFKMAIAEDLTNSVDKTLKQCIANEVDVRTERVSCIKNFWSTPLVNESISKINADWKRNYVTSLINRIEFRQHQLELQILRNSSDLNTIYSDQLIKRKYLVLGAFVFGLLIFPIINLGPIYLTKLFRDD